LIPLYAVGAFLAFTLSQLGMVFHWKRVRGPTPRYMFINGLGGFVTGITVVVVLVAKFVDGAWITMLLIPALLWLMYAVHRHYQRVSVEVADSTPLDLAHFRPPW
jgi:amino acid transporter